MCIRSSGRPHYWNMAALEREIPVGFVAYSCNMRFCIRIANYEKYVVWTLIDKIWAQLNWNFRRLIDMKVNIFLLVFARSEGRQFECGLVAILLGPTIRSYISLHSIKCTVFLFLCLLWGFQKALDSYLCCLFFSSAESAARNSNSEINGEHERCWQPHIQTTIYIMQWPWASIRRIGSSFSFTAPKCLVLKL